jgi:hypothetical protein
LEFSVKVPEHFVKLNNFVDAVFDIYAILFDVFNVFNVTTCLKFDNYLFELKTQELVLLAENLDGLTHLLIHVKQFLLSLPQLLAWVKFNQLVLHFVGEVFLVLDALADFLECVL